MTRAHGASARWRVSGRIVAITIAVILGLGHGSGRVAAQNEGRPQNTVAPEPKRVEIDVDARLADARTFMLHAQYDEAITLLQELLDSIRPDRDRLEQTYLLLIESHVYSANNTETGKEVVRELWMEKAAQLVHECLSQPDLRHTRPDPLDSPVEMLQLFESARQELFGKVTIHSVDPPDAEVILDGERLHRGEDGTWLVEDVPTGLRTLIVRHPDRRTQSLDLTVGAGQWLVRTVRLEKKRGVGWYATRVALPVGVAGTLVGVLAGGNRGGSSGEDILDGSPPAPPNP
jgi:hypothetical protein